MIKNQENLLEIQNITENRNNQKKRILNKSKYQNGMIQAHPNIQIQVIHTQNDINNFFVKPKYLRLIIYQIYVNN